MAKLAILRIIMIFTVGVLLSMGGLPERSSVVEANQKKPMEGFLIFQYRPLARRGQHRNYDKHQSPWKNMQKKNTESSKTFGNGGGVRLALVHRDAPGSPFRSSPIFRDFVREKENVFAEVFDKLVKRDATRVRAIDAIVTKRQQVQKNTPAGTASTPENGAPLESPVISGLEFGSGEYFTTVSIGSPPTEVLMTIDTGSDLVWLQCHPCQNCYDQIGPIFNPELSQSYETESCISRACGALPRGSCQSFNCQYTESYGDGSFSRGDLATETIIMNSTTTPIEIPGIVFGCGHDNQGLFTASGGLLGLGRGQLSFPSQIANVVAPRFSYCLSDRFAGNADGGAGNSTSKDITIDRSHGERQHEDHEIKYTENGDDDGDERDETSYLFFGESETLCSDMKYTDLLRNPSTPSFYYLRLTGISVADEQVDIPASVLELDTSSGRGGVILDTGTSITRVASQAYVAMRDSFRRNAKHLRRIAIPDQQLFDTCFRLLDGQEVPTVTLHFAPDADLVLPFDNVLIPVDDSGLLYCFAFARSDSRADFTIIGNVQQQGFRFEFDLGKERVGFTRQDCSTSL